MYTRVYTTVYTWVHSPALSIIPIRLPSVGGAWYKGGAKEVVVRIQMGNQGYIRAGGERAGSGGGLWTVEGKGREEDVDGAERD